MLIVGNCIVSEDVAECCFDCSLQECKGQCCVEGDAGAPLTLQEVTLLQELLPHIVPYMTEAGRYAVEQHGVNQPDCTGEPCTTLVEGRECAFVTWQEGIALCAIEKAYRDGAIPDFRKPISCHLYPLRIADYGEFRAINYHRWEVCHCAIAAGNRNRVPLYQYLQEPLTRRFGAQWYSQLQAACEDYIAKKRARNQKK